ncbi:MAG: serine protease [Bacteroidetes bacterium]|nr:serine protease [Bacteroidota bacterium]
MKRLILLLTLFLTVTSLRLKADEGMWLPSLIQSQNYEEMVRLGLKLTPEQIYDINNSSLKDAIVRLGGGFCTGEIVSAEGLFITNHHCGYDALQSVSDKEHNYLRDGYWAMSRDKETQANFGISLLVRIEDVTDKVTEGLTESMSLEDRNKKVLEHYKDITKGVEDKDNFISGTVKSFYEGNKYYLFVYQTFPDVRLVGAPPESLGKFGGETDNWMWPRHTADFSMFRIYASKDNKPAEYSKDNVPFKPKHFLPVSMKGIEKGDYAMIFGYPGSTDRYLTSYGVRYDTDVEFPARVKVRRTKLDIYEKYQAQDEGVDLQYASKYAQVSNYWKNFMGQTKALKKLHVYEMKKAEEDAFEKWVAQDNTRKELYGNVIKMYADGYAKIQDYEYYRTYINEAFFGIEMMQIASLFSSMADAETDEARTNLAERVQGNIAEFFKDYYMPLDRDVFAAMLKYMYEDLDHKMLPTDFLSLVKKYKGDFTKMSQVYYKKSKMTSQEGVLAYLSKPNAGKYKKDPMYKLYRIVMDHYWANIRPTIDEAQKSLTPAKRLYVKGLMEMNPNHHYSADANSTMRVTYGNVKDYYPADAVHYNYFTTMDGVLEKYIPKDGEFDLPARFVELAKAKNYGQYADSDGVMHICFLTNNDITGGNSGSPVINGKGELIGTAFDGNWEAMSGDIAFEPQLQRTISVDIRYILWVIDVYAGAGHLVSEMTLVK